MLRAIRKLLASRLFFRDLPRKDIRTSAIGRTIVRDRRNYTDDGKNDGDRSGNQPLHGRSLTPTSDLVNIRLRTKGPGYGGSQFPLALGLRTHAFIP